MVPFFRSKALMLWSVGTLTPFYGKVNCPLLSPESTYVSLTIQRWVRGEAKAVFLLFLFKSLGLLSKKLRAFSSSLGNLLAISCWLEFIVGFRYHGYKFNIRRVCCNFIHLASEKAFLTSCIFLRLWKPCYEYSHMMLDLICVNV